MPLTCYEKVFHLCYDQLISHPFARLGVFAVDHRIDQIGLVRGMSFSLVDDFLTHLVHAVHTFKIFAVGGVFHLGHERGPSGPAAILSQHIQHVFDKGVHFVLVEAVKSVIHGT